MNGKALAILFLTVAFLYQLLLDLLTYASAKRGVPAGMENLYDSETYAKQQAYQREKARLSVWRHAVSYLCALLLLLFDVYARIANGLFPQGFYLPALAVLLADLLIGTVTELPFAYTDTLRIEQKYGFNRSGKAQFAIDQIKDMLFGAVLTGGLCCLFIGLHLWLGNRLPFVLLGVLLVIVLVACFLTPLFGRLHNRFTPLPEGTLRTRLEQLLTENGCTVRGIRVMDGSKRTSKANAYFSGLGRSKTIVLFDTLLEQLTEDEIVAVFAHETGHSKHHDTLKGYAMSMLPLAVFSALAWAAVSFPAIYADFGFDRLNYGFALYLMLTVVFPLLSPLSALLRNMLSRRQERRADAFAAEKGYAIPLASALRKLTKNTLSCLDPHPLSVALTYSHPTAKQRIDALRSYSAKAGSSADATAK